VRKRITYANVVATLALVFAMSGGALAANHYLISSTKQLSPKVLKKLKGKIGKSGANGAAGGQGPAGPFVTTLPSGQTLRGNYAGRAFGGETAGQEMQIPITFAFPLTTAPAAHYILNGTAPPSQCPGTAADPQALPGNLCVYESTAALSATKIRVFDPIGGDDDTANRFGAGVAAESTAAKAEFRIRGSWAVTAP